MASILMEDHATMRPGEVLENARLIHDAATRLHHLIENFLAYAQIEIMAKDAKLILARASQTFTETSPIVRDAAARVVGAHKREQDLRLEVRPATVPVIPDNLQKIVEELVDNACKFSEPGTPVHVNASAANGHFTLQIVNTGRGMTAEQIAAIGPHVQFNRQIYEQQGAGLGLIISKRLTELNGGQFTITSTPGQETRVTISLPAPISLQK
jgi:two-component system, sensor histidine kinase and response regulator